MRERGPRLGALRRRWSCQLLKGVLGVVDVTIETDVISVATSPAKRKRPRLVIAGVSRHDSVTHGHLAPSRFGHAAASDRQVQRQGRTLVRRTRLGSAPPWPES